MLIRCICTAGLLVASCQGPSTSLREPDCSRQDLMSQQDLAPAPAKCAAAKGLSGDVLLCVDFDKVTGLDAKELKGWDFNVFTACSGWEISNGNLQIKDFQNLAKDCAFLMPMIDITDGNIQNAQELILSVSFSLDINRLKQSAKISIGGMTDERNIWQSFNGQINQNLIIKMSKPNIPNGGNNVYQPVFQLSSMSANSGFNGWQIKSIAVMSYK